MRMRSILTGMGLGLAVLMIVAAAVPLATVRPTWLTTNVTTGTFIEGQVAVWNSTMKKWTNATPSGGSVSTNGNQFLGVPLSVKDSAKLTNLFLYGNTFLPVGSQIIGDGSALTNLVGLSAGAGDIPIVGVADAASVRDFGYDTGHFTYDITLNTLHAWNQTNFGTLNVASTITAWSGLSVVSDTLSAGAGITVTAGGLTVNQGNILNVGSFVNRSAATVLGSFTNCGGALISSAAPISDTSTSTNFWEAGNAYPGATTVTSGGQLHLSGGLSPARIAITNWNRFTNSICTNVISTVDGVFTVYATNGAAAGMWTNGANMATCATNLATNINNALIFGSSVRISNYVNVVANLSNVFFYPLARCEGITCGSVTNGATNLNATVNAVLLQPVSGNVGIGTNAPVAPLTVMGEQRWYNTNITDWLALDWTNIAGSMLLHTENSGGTTRNITISPGFLSGGNASVAISSVGSGGVSLNSNLRVNSSSINGVNGLNVTSKLLSPNPDNTVDLGTNGQTFRNLMMSGKASVGGQNQLAQMTVTNSASAAQVAFRTDQQGTTNSIAQYINNNALVHTVETNGTATYYNNTAAPTSITVGSSVFNYTNVTGVNIQVFLDANGATTAVSLNGTTIFGSLVGGDHTIIMKPNARIGVTYSVATPVMSYTEL